VLPTDEQPVTEWHEVGGSRLIPPVLIAVSSRRQSNRDYIDIFLRCPISRDMGFSDVLYNSYHLAGKLGRGAGGSSTCSITFRSYGWGVGHHKGGTEKTLAYAFIEEFPRRGWTVTNFAHHLSLNTPRMGSGTGSR